MVNSHPRIPYQLRTVHLVQSEILYSCIGSELVSIQLFSHADTTRNLTWIRSISVHFIKKTFPMARCHVLQQYSNFHMNLMLTASNKKNLNTVHVQSYIMTEQMYAYN